jgi:hypothetical protein
MTESQTPKKGSEDRAPLPPTKFFSTRAALDNLADSFRSGRPTATKPRKGEPPNEK